MSGKFPSLLVFVLLLGAGWADSSEAGRDGGSAPVRDSVPALEPADPRAGARHIGLPAEGERLWVWNLGDRPARVSLEATGTDVRVAAGEVAEVPQLMPERLGLAMVAKGDDLLLVRASEDLDPGSFEIDLRGEVRHEKAGRRTRVRVVRPAWAQDLLAMAASSARLAAGQEAGVVAEAGPDGHLRVAVGLEEDSAVTVTVEDEDGVVLRAFSASSTTPVRWRADLGSGLGSVRVALRVDRGGAIGGVPVDVGDPGKPGNGRIQWITAAVTVGSASFSQNIVRSGSYTFSVTNGPANTCGELDIKRNGNWEFTPGWFCTDNNGNGTKGPWNWSDKASDETGDPVFVRWPDNSTTTETFIIIDKACANTHRDSPSGAPPTSYYGRGTDAQWGTGFDFGGDCDSDFQDLTTGKYFDTLTGGYTSTGFKLVGASVSRVNRWNVDWSTVFPPVGAHTSGHQYRWVTCCHDGSCGFCTVLTFTVP